MGVGGTMVLTGRMKVAHKRPFLQKACCSANLARGKSEQNFQCELDVARSAHCSVPQAEVGARRIGVEWLTAPFQLISPSSENMPIPQVEELRSELNPHALLDANVLD